MLHSFQCLQPGDRGERLVGFPVQDEQVRQCPQYAGVFRRELCCNQQIDRAPPGLAVTSVKMTKDMQQVRSLAWFGQIPVPPCRRPSNSRWRSISSSINVLASVLSGSPPSRSGTTSVMK